MIWGISVGEWMLHIGLWTAGFIALALVLWAVFRILPSPWQDRVSPDRHEYSAEETLKQRFARGEIDAEDYERSLEVLRGGRVSENGGVSEWSSAKEV
jgi:putative membrane protein